MKSKKAKKAKMILSKKKSSLVLTKSLQFPNAKVAWKEK